MTSKHPERSVDKALEKLNKGKDSFRYSSKAKKDDENDENEEEEVLNSHDTEKEGDVSQV